MTPSDPHGPRVLLVEDDDVVAETLATYLSHAGYGVERVSSGTEGLERALQPGIALVILDWMIPGLNGHEVCRRLRAASGVPIIMLTARTAEDDRVRGLQSGADDYVPKPFSPREVVARVEALLRRAGRPESAAGPAPLRVGRLEIDALRREVSMAGRAVPLTRTELRLLEALASRPGRTFTREELIARAFGPDYDGADRTVDTHITNLRRKLEAPPGTRCIATVHGVGYRLVAGEDV